MLQVLKLTTAFMLGVPAGGYIVHQLETKPLVDYVARGFCGQRDIAGTFYLFACQDAIIAAQIHVQDVQTDQIVASMGKNQPTRKKKP